MACAQHMARVRCPWPPRYAGPACNSFLPAGVGLMAILASFLVTLPSHSLNPALPHLKDEEGNDVQFRRTLLNKCQVCCCFVFSCCWKLQGASMQT